jgi:hypothetical protein
MVHSSSVEIPVVGRTTGADGQRARHDGTRNTRRDGTRSHRDAEPDRGRVEQHVLLAGAIATIAALAAHSALGPHAACAGRAARETALLARRRRLRGRVVRARAGARTAVRTEEERRRAGRATTAVATVAAAAGDGGLVVAMIGMVVPPLIRLLGHHHVGHHVGHRR